MRDYFCGWYFKCQSDTQTLAIIPAMHIANDKSSCSVQLITNEGAWNINFPYEEFSKIKNKFHIQIGENSFGNKGLRLSVHSDVCSASGYIEFGALTSIKYDIMGPFRYVPFMECRHSVISMKHSVNGKISINGIDYLFHNSDGYIEGDRGYSFPKNYVWTQCFFDGGSLMFSVADIPIGRFHFTGIIGILYFHEKEYRIATYLGAKAVRIENGEIVIRQGHMILYAKLIEKYSHPLFAPVNGSMSRTIHESASCRAYYHFKLNRQTIFSFESSKASFEYEYLR